MITLRPCAFGFAANTRGPTIPAARGWKGFTISMRDNEIAKLWNQNAEAWTRKVRRGRDDYRKFLRDPAFRRFVGDIRDHNVLDVACGEGDSSRQLARQGAQVTGVDIARRMLDLARGEETRRPLSIEYLEVSASDLSVFPDGTFNDVVCTALMNISGLDPVIREFFRVLREGGALSFCVRHPCFSATPGAQIVGNPQTKHRGLLVRGYFRDEPWTEKKPCRSGPGDTGEEDTFISPTFPYTVSTYLNAVIDAGFVLTRVEEPRPSEEDCRNRKWLDFWRRHAAMYLMVRAEKPAFR